ncbi:hypothetical protein [Ruegeria arenilitoris]|uniref:hypothetical protein n=1 Tax=Ruegeria arenilitoris TaxID=1173585 RepID=UPI0014798AFE|nr:hypothetical protein [Ruegeria arenilitoris]
MTRHEKTPPSEIQRQHDFLLRLRVLVGQHGVTLIHAPGRYRIERGDLTLTVEHDPDDPEAELSRVEQALSGGEDWIMERLERARPILEQQSEADLPRRRRRRRPQP